MALIATLWITSLLIDKRVRIRRTMLDGPLAAMLLALLCSIAPNATRIGEQHLESYVAKTLTFFVSFVIVYYVITSVVRTWHEIDTALALLVGCGTVVAVFALFEARTGINVFNHLSRIAPILHQHAGGYLVPRGGAPARARVGPAPDRARGDARPAPAVRHVPRNARKPQALARLRRHPRHRRRLHGLAHGHHDARRRGDRLPAPAPGRDPPPVAAAPAARGGRPPRSAGCGRCPEERVPAEGRHRGAAAVGGEHAREAAGSPISRRRSRRSRTARSSGRARGRASSRTGRTRMPRSSTISGSGCCSTPASSASSCSSG